MRATLAVLLFTLVWGTAYWWVLKRMARNLDRHHQQKQSKP